LRHVKLPIVGIVSKRDAFVGRKNSTSRQTDAFLPQARVSLVSRIRAARGMVIAVSVLRTGGTRVNHFINAGRFVNNATLF
jgi:hypothetical protein